MSDKPKDAEPGADPVAPAAPASAETTAILGSVEAGEAGAVAESIKPAARAAESGNPDETAKPAAPHTETVPVALAETAAAVVSDEPAQPAEPTVAQASGEPANESAPHGEHGEPISGPSGPLPDNASEVSLHAMSGFSLGLSVRRLRHQDPPEPLSNRTICRLIQIIAMPTRRLAWMTRKMPSFSM